MDAHILRLVNSNKILALAWNYIPSKSPVPDPVIFQKSVSTVIPSNSLIHLPKSENLLHESNTHIVELAFYISKQATNVSASQAYEYILGYCLALDMTSSTILTKQKKYGLSWDLGKSLPTSLPLSSFIPASQISDPHALTLSLTVNSTLKQFGHTKDMVHKIPKIIEYITANFTLNAGDLILTGTPPGAADVHSGDFLYGQLLNNGQVLLDLKASVV